MLNFQCKFCETDIQSDYSYIGEFVQCPVCDSYLIVPDPILPYNSDFHGYRIEKMRASTLLWNTYEVSSVDDEGNSFLSLLRVPGAFFLKCVTDFDEFSNVVIKSGAVNIAGIPHLKDYSLVPGKVFFLFEHFKSYDLETFISKKGPLDLFNALEIVRNVSESLSQGWSKSKAVHQNILPRNIRINNKLETRIMNIGLSQYLLKDQTLLEQGFNIWDQRYMSPEFALQGKGDTPGCDIYALGAILYFMLTGKHPYMNIPLDAIHTSPVPDMNLTLPDPVRALVQLMMAKQTSIRLKAWHEVIERIDAINTKSKKPSKKKQFPDFYTNYSSHSAPVRLMALSSARRGASTEKIKIKKAAAEKSEMTDTVAKLATPELKAINAQWRQRKAQPKSSGLKNYTGLLIVLFIALFIGIPVLFIVFKDRLMSVSDKDISGGLKNAVKPESAAVADAEKEKPGDMTQAPGNQKDASIETEPDQFVLEMNEIDNFCKNNPDKIQQAIKKYNALSEKALFVSRTDIFKAIEKKVALLEKKTEAHFSEKISIVMAELTKKVIPLLKNRKYDEAIKIITDYDGEMEAETTSDRKKLVQEIRDTIKSVRNKVDDIELALNVLAEKLAPRLLKKDFMYSEIQLKLATTVRDRKLPDDVLNDWIKQISEYETLSKKYLPSENADDIIDANIKLLDGAHIVKGLIFYEREQYDAAIKEFEKVPYKGGTPFISRISKIIENNNADSRYNDSVAEFTKILKKYSFKFNADDQNDLLLQLTRHRISKKASVAFASSVQAFIEDKNNKRFYENYGILIDAISIYCRRIGGEGIKAKSGVVKIYPVDNLTYILNNTKPGITYLLTDGEYKAKKINITASDISITGDANTIIKAKSFSIKGSNIKITNLKFKNSVILFNKVMDMEVGNCFFEESMVRISTSSDSSFDNCFFNGMEIKNSGNIKFTHCNFLSGSTGRTPLVLDTEELLIKDSIIYGAEYGIIVSSDKTNRKYVIEGSMIFGEKGLCVKKIRKNPIDKKNIATKFSQLRRYIKIKSNIDKPPQFTNPQKGDYRLVKGVPGFKDASDDKDCGVIW